MKPACVMLSAALLLAVPAAAQTLMAQVDVETAFKGNTFTLTGQTGYTGTITFNPDLTATVKGGDGSNDTGTYRFAEGGYCSIWVNFRKGVEACFTVEDLGGGRYQLYTLDGGKDDLFVKQ